ncbi:hypothetical protein PYK79_11065 [Streptomyces sp. ID05-04B]|uniref:hypothetical protein n=1 Tax=Streptomyces sp. ID05-04B TaxID=3028661 RepID=UPI0029C3FF41|nr:hypothetical protein [Streptomyces sp. ID05-04B]MDX5563794.1 hypothetical protein [Streptomyces sp. ID05-04B]
MPGATHGRPFQGLPIAASEVRAWARQHTRHPDAPAVANELFLAVLASGADTVDVQVSTTDRRLKITAVGPHALSLRHSHGPGWRIVAGLSNATGVTTDEHGLWAQIETGP